MKRIFNLLMLVVILLAAMGATPVRAAGTLTVTNANDSGAGSLRQAILDAVSGDTINFDASYTITLSSQLTVDKVITIIGNGSANTVIQANAMPNTATYRVIEVTSTGNLTLDGVTVKNGRCNGACGVTYADGGGGVINFGTLTVTNSVFSGNSAANGGGIYCVNNTTLTVTNSTFSGNSASVNGGGIYTVSKSNTTITVANSTFSGNSAYYLGGGINNGHILTLTNSTFSGNSANNGGGISNIHGTLMVTNSTFSGNSVASLGSDIFNGAGTAVLKNTILANNIGNGDCYINGGTVTASNSLVENASNCDIANGVNGNIVGLDPRLGLLANNGGPTQTFALLPGSPAINKGDDAVCVADPVNNLDQRSVTRSQGGHCDIGSVESPLTGPVTATFQSVAAQDGWVLETSETSGIGGSVNTSNTNTCLGDNATRRQYRSILSFNTGAKLPDNAIITAITLRVKQRSITGVGNPVSIFQGFVVDIKNGFFGSSGALQVEDFQATATKTYGPFITAPASGGWYNINLTNAKAIINKLSGLTQLKLRFKLDDNNDALPNYLCIYSGDAATYSPRLNITYYIP